jgi:hypothetical protein
MENTEKNKRVIELAVIDDLEDSGVTALSLVDEPAIEKYWVYMKQQNFVDPQSGETEDEFINRCMSKLVGDEGYENEQAYAICINTYENKSVKQKFESYTDYPESAKNAAKRALDWAEKNGWGDCGTPIGKARANQLAKGEPISEETIARMASFARHAQNKDNPYSESCGGLMWDAWGGTAGIEWAQNKLESIREKMGTDTSGLSPYVDEVPKKKKKFAEDCPPATLDISLNLANRQKAIDKAMYGPLDVKNPGDYWDKIANKWKVPVEEAKGEICGNCAAFNITKKMKACIAEGIGEDAEAVIEAGELGYCEFFDFKCNANRSCAAHVDGGPIIEEKFIEPNPCWEGYEAYGTKIIDGREVPNCVPIQNSKYTRISEYNTKFTTDEEKQIIVGAAMIPDMLIYRRDENGKDYYVKFSKETIAKVAEKFMSELRVHSTNLQHNEEIDGGSFVYESWITETVDDKANSKYNLDVPVGTWMIKLKVKSPEVWEAVKAGKYRGFSIEGNFVDKKELETMEEEKAMVEKIMSILNS